ncbi:ligand of Numb protein X 2a isoform X2 [Chanodichthys erythropterus]|uniref:ligand of Numb protein X 2a isoform X2 n=1 Tax=Chanodichthys erythropterus TaxID=933992 RepID=UPI00351EDABE
MGSLGEGVDPGMVSEALLEALCSECGQIHRAWENHLYNYRLEVDDDLVCHICLQPLVQPLDTPCGHTFCARCLRSFLQERDFCPLDRAHLQLQVCRRSSILVHKLLDKLSVTCPLTPSCSFSMPRCDLEAHLKHRCPGTQSQRTKLDRTRMDGGEDRVMATNPPRSPQTETKESTPSPPAGSNACNNVPTWTEEPGVDNPAFEESTEEDSVHGLECAPPRVKRPLSNPCIHLLRTGSSASSGWDFVETLPLSAEEGCVKLPSLPEGEITTIEVHRANPYTELGISIVGGNETPLINVVIQEVYRDGVIARDGRLLAGDQILQASGERVNLLISRSSKQTMAVHTGSTLTRDIWSHEHIPPLPCTATPSPVPSLHLARSSTQRDLSQCVTCKEKHITVKKEPHESLGMTVAGGRGSKSGELPIFVTSVQPHGCLSRDGRIKRGDVLLSINGQDLTYLSHSEAVGTLKSSAASCSVQLKALEVNTVEEPGLDEELLPPHENDYDASWSPSWVMWLGLPSYLHSSHEIVLRRSHPGSWGFSIVGGYEENHSNQAFFIKTIVLGTPAYYDGRLKCGDMIVAVNCLSTAGMSHSALVPMLKEQRSRVALTVVSWPGSLI